MTDSNESKNWSFDTKAIHSGQSYEQWKHLEIVPPIVTSMTFYQNDPTQMKGHFYSRLSNPTREALENCLASLEDAKYGLVYPSGVAALTAILSSLKTGDHIVSCDEQFGGSRVIILDYVKINGIELDLIDGTDLKQIEKAIKPNTKLLWIETPSNPCMKISDIKAIAKIAHSNNRNIILAVDNTWQTPYFQLPLELGADITLYSLTKYMNGHADVLGGALILNDDKIYERLSFYQRQYGSVLSPFDCYLVNRGLKTLSMRMQKHYESGLAVARFLEKHPKVVGVSHPFLPSHPHHALAKKQSTGHCGMVTFHLNGTLEHAKKFIQSLRIFTSSTSLGSFDSMAIIPACVSHRSMPKETREKLGISDSTIRLSVGLEHINDLVADLDQAFKQAFQ